METLGDILDNLPPARKAGQHENQIVLNMPADEYHRDLAVSRSQLVDISKSPRHFWWNHLSGLAEKKETKALRFGSAFHTLVLEPDQFNQRCYVWSGQSRATKEGKAEYADALEKSQGKTLLKQDEFDQAQAMAKALLSEPAASKVLAAHGKIEASLFWRDPDHGVNVKARPDYYRDDGIVLDLKTTEDAGKEEFERSIVKYFYDVQAYMQIEGIYQVTGKRPDNFVFVCQEKSPPYCTAFYVAGNDLIESGRHRYNRLMRKYAECSKTGQWPGYGSLIQPIGVPVWFLKRLEELEEFGG